MTLVVLACPLSPGAQKLSKDGLEQHMQVNHLASALLTILLLPSLLRGSPSRVVVVNSMMHHLGFVDPEDLQGGKRRYNSTSGYSDSKLAQVRLLQVLEVIYWGISL
jgi:NAD(P)-dependent dehydrogenase (short-subunit alcohol dehydrogenase family)